MSRFISVEGFPGFVRDRATNAILNMDTTAIEEAKRRKAIRKEKQLEEQNMKNKINELESDIKKIKELVEILVKDKI